MTQAKFRGLMPWAHLPFIATARSLPGRRHSATTVGGVDRGLGHRGPGPCAHPGPSPTWRWPASPRAGRRSAPAPSVAVGRRRAAARGTPCGSCRPATGIARSRPARRGGASRPRLWAGVLPKPMPGSIQTSSTPAVAGLLGRARPGTSRPRRRRRRSAGRPASCAGSPCMCIATQPTPHSAAATTVERGRHVVDQRGAGGDRGLGHAGLAGVDRDPDRRRRAPRCTGRTRPQLLGLGDRLGAGTASTRRRRRSRRRPRRSSAEAVGDRGGRVEVAPAVGERVGRDVDDPHDQRPHGRGHARPCTC